MILRPAMSADIPFIAEIQARPEFHAVIAEDGPDTLAGYLEDDDHAVLIWQDPAPPRLRRPA